MKENLRTTTKAITRQKVPTSEKQWRLLGTALVKGALSRYTESGRKLYGDGRAWASVASQVLRRRLGYGQRHGLRAMNPYAGDVWVQFLGEALQAVPATQEARFATLLEAEWDFPSHRAPLTSSDLQARIREIQRQVRNRLAPLDFLLQLDISLHRRKGDAGERRVCVHFHGFIWGDGDQIKKAMERFKRGFDGAPGGKAKPISCEGEGWGGIPHKLLAYITKDTRVGSNHFERPRGEGKTPRRHSFKEPLTANQRLFLLDLFGDMTKPDLCIGSGYGTTVLRFARERAKLHGWKRPRSWR